MAARRRVRGGRDRDARQRHPDVAGAGVDRVADRRADAARSPAGRRLGLVLVACGFGSYCFYIYQETGNPLLWAAAISRWGYLPGRRAVDGAAASDRALVTHPYGISRAIRWPPTTR